MVWESIPVKAQLRSTIQRLGQLQAKTDTDAATTRREIANLLLHDHVAIARAKTQELMQEDVFADLLEDLEQQVGTVLEHFSELDQGPSAPPSPTLLEASSSVIFAAPHTHIKELNSISDILSERLGQNVTSSSNHVASGITRALSRKPLTAAQLDSYMEKIAQSHGVSWTAGPQRQDLVKPLSELLDPNTAPLVDMTRLRDICNQGIPDDPPWLRARIWKLFLNILPSEKGSWKTEIEKQRVSYYDLIRRLLVPFTELPPPKHPISGSDKILLEVYQHLARVPVELFSQLDSEPEEINTCPLHQNANEDILIPYSNCLDIRLNLLRRLNEDAQTYSNLSTPEIRLETDSPSISLTEPDTPNETGRPTTLLTSKLITLGSASQRHATALLRLLYIHASINPGNLSPYVPSLLVPLYTVLSREIEIEDLAHAEADCFWLFEALVGEFSELEDDEGCSRWMKELEERLKWADVDLSDQLSAMGLSPTLPHYSQRWLSSLLTHTLPLPAVYPVWDVILSHPRRGHNQHPQLDSLLDIATCMVTAAGPLLLSGKKPSNNLLGRWVKDSSATRAPEDGFLEGLSILQLYPIHAVGGIESILKSAAVLSQRRKTTGMTKKAQMGLGARIKVTMWKGFTNQIDSPDRSPDRSDDEKEVVEDKSDDTSSEDETDDGNDTETPSKVAPNDSLTSRLATTVWRGITNQSSMEPPPSPILPSPDGSRPATPPLSPEQQKTASLPTPPPQSKETTNSAPANLWAYTEKLKDSDTMATFAKISSNWRAKAMLTTWGRSKAPDTAPPGPIPEVRSAFSSPVLRSADADMRRSSLPVYDHTGAIYTPPPRPSFFHNPRDSFLPSGATTMLLSPETPPNDETLASDKSSNSLIDKTRNLQNSLLSLTRTPPQKASPPPKSAPRPLLLNSSSLMTSQRSGKTRVDPETKVDEWGHILNQRSHLNRDSMSSVSSLSPSDALHRSLKNGRSEYDSDASTSRVVPLNRRSVSPMALASLSLHSRPPSSTSTISSDQGSGTPSTPARQISPVIQEPPALNSSGNDIVNGGIDDSYILSERPSLSRRTYRKKQSNPSVDTSDSSSVGDVTSRSARLRSKRHPPRLSSLHIENTPQSMDNKATSPSNLTVLWPAQEDPAVTPRASTFDSSDLASSPVKSPKIAERTRTPSNASRSRKLSNNSRTRKVSGGNRDSHHTRDSAAEDGDDEGYDDLLSAYESEESSYLT